MLTRTSCIVQVTLLSSVQLLSRVWFFVTPWTIARQASLSITNSWSLLKLMFIESVMPSNHLILCNPPFLLPSIFPSIRIFSNESALRIRWPKYWSFSFNISPFNEYSGLISFRIDWLYSLIHWLKCSTWVQSQKRQNDLCSFPRKNIQYHRNPSLYPDQ